MRDGEDARRSLVPVSLVGSPTSLACSGEPYCGTLVAGQASVVKFDSFDHQLRTLPDFKTGYGLTLVHSQELRGRDYAPAPLWVRNPSTISFASTKPHPYSFRAV